MRQPIDRRRFLAGSVAAAAVVGAEAQTQAGARLRGGGTYAAMAGTTAYFQAWHRDVHPTVAGAPWAQLSHGLEILWY